MADISDVNSALQTKLTGQDTTGLETNPVNASTSGLMVDVQASVLPTGASTSALQTTGNSSLSSIDTKIPALGQALAAASTPVVLTAAQITTLTPLSSVTVTQATGTNLHTVVDSSALPTGAATAANQTTEITALQLIDDIPSAMNAAFSKGAPAMGQLDDTSTTAATEDNVAPVRITAQRAFHTNLRNNAGTEIATAAAPLRTDPTGTTSQPIVGNVASGVTDSGNPVKIGGVYNTILPVVTTGQRVDLQLDANGRLLTSSVSLPTAASKFSFGKITTTTTTQVAIFATTYTEQTTNGQRSIASASANDSAAGTGARTVRITYLDQTGAGPFTETLTLNGTTAANTVSTTICFIEKIEALTVGSGGVTAGIVSIYTAINKGGSIFGSIAAGENQTFWAHHYVPTGKISYLSGFNIGNTSTTAGGGGVYVLKAVTPTIANTAEIQISDSLNSPGAVVSTTRVYNSPIQISGPARIRAYVTPSASASYVNFASFDYIDN